MTRARAYAYARRLALADFSGANFAPGNAGYLPVALRRDHIDLLCESWAKVRRELMGLRHPLNAAEYIGAPRCTLAARRDLPTGVRGTRRVVQHWPEVYSPELQTINRAFKLLTEEQRMLMDVHWTVQKPRSKNVRAELLGLSPGQYWRRVGQVKEFLHGAVAISSDPGDEN